MKQLEKKKHLYWLIGILIIKSTYPHWRECYWVSNPCDKFPFHACT